MYPKERKIAATAIIKSLFILLCFLCLCYCFVTGHFVVNADNGHIGALFDNEEVLSAELNGEYLTLAEALNTARDGDTVRFFGSVIEEDLVVLNGTCLYIDTSKSNNPIHIKMGVKLTVDGKLVIGNGNGINSAFDEALSVTSVICDGTIIVNGEAEVYSVVAGGGGFDVYGKLFEPFDYLDYTDENSFIGNEHALTSVKIKRTIFEEASYVGKFIRTEKSVCIVGSVGIIRVKNGRVEFDYDQDKNIGQFAGDRNLKSFGKTRIKLFGSVYINSETLEGLKKSNVISLPYNYEVVLSQKSKAVIERQTEIKVLPGAGIVIDEGATLDVFGDLSVYDALITPSEGVTYPSAQILYDYGYKKTGALTVNGNLNVTGSFAGLIQTKNLKGQINIDKNARLKKVVKENYGTKIREYSATFTLNAKVKSVYDFEQLKQDKTYKSYAISPFKMNFALFDKICDGKNTVSNYKLYLYEEINGAFLETDENGRRCDLPFYIGEKVKNVEVTVQGKKRFTDENGEFTASVYIEGPIDDILPIEYCSPLTDKRFFVKPKVDEKVILGEVAKSVKLKDDNDYVIRYDKTLQKFFAEIEFYGGKTKLIEVTTNVTASEKYAEVVTFSSDEYMINENLYAIVNFYKKDLDDYKNEFNGLIGGDLSQKRVASLYKEYKTVVKNRSEYELNFLSEALNGYDDYLYFIDFTADGITYGDEKAFATVISIDGREEEKYVLLSNYEYENGEISVTAKLNAKFYGVNYTLEKRLKNVAKSKITYLINAKSSCYLDELSKLDGKIKEGELKFKDDESIISLSTEATKGSPKGWYPVTGKCLSPFYEVKFLNATYTINPKKTEVSVTDAEVSFDNQKSVAVKYTESHSGTIKGFTVYKNNEKVAIIDLYANLSQVLDVGEYVIEPEINENFLLEKDCRAKLTITPNEDKYSVSFGFTSGAVEEYYGKVFNYFVRAINKKTNEIYDGNIETSIAKDGKPCAEIKDCGFYTINAVIDGEDYYAFITIKPRRVIVTVEDFSYYYGDMPTDIRYTTSCVVPKNSLELSVYGETITATIDDKNYVVDKISGSVKKLPRPITVQALETVKYYGDKDRTIEYKIVEGSMAAYDTLYSVVKIARKEGEAAGDYEVTAECLFKERYDVKFIPAKYRILPRPVTVTCHDLFFTYGEDIELSASVTDGRLAFDDEISDVAKFIPPDKTVGRREYFAKAINDNYDVTIKPATLTIFPKKITVILPDGAKRYGEADKYGVYCDEAIDESLEKIVKINRQAGENVGNYEMTIETIDFNYSVKSVYTNGTYSSFTIKKSPVEVEVGDISADFAKTYDEILLLANYKIKSGVAYSDFKLNYFISDKGALLSGDFFGKPSAIGSYLLSAETNNQNYDATVTPALLTVTKRRLSLKDVEAKYIYSGKDIVVFDKNKNVDGLLDFDAEFSVKNYFVEAGGKVFSKNVINAGEYLISVELLDNVYYEMEKAEFTITVLKKDVSDKLKVNLSHKDFAVVGDNRPIALLFDYSAEVITTVLFKGKEVSSIDAAGKYVLVAKINDENLTGEINFDFYAYENVKNKTEEISVLLQEAKNNESVKLKNLLKIKSAILKFSKTDKAQIEQNPVYKSIIDDFVAEYESFYSEVNAKFITAKSVYDKISFNYSVVSAVAVAAICLFIKRVIK